MHCFQTEIQFDRHPPIYTAGEQLSGRLILGVRRQQNSTQTSSNSDQTALLADSAAINVRLVTVSILGDARNSWVSKNSDKIYESDETYLNHEMPITDKAVDIHPGRHEFAFSFDLPPTLPSSYESEYGRIRYVIQVAAASNAAGTDLSTERQFGVVSRLNLSSFPTTQQPVEAIDATEISCCCLPLGSVRAVIMIPKNGYTTNEAIPISAVIFNGTRKKITRTTINLIQQARFVARSRYENAQDTKERHYCIATIRKGSIESRTFLRMDKELMVLPFLVPTYCGSIISVSYVLRIEADPGLEITIPIIIGSAD